MFVRSFTLLVMLAVVGCSPVSRLGRCQTEDGRCAPPALRVWIAPNRHVPASVADAGCAYWVPVGVRCARAANRRAANIRIVVTEGSCEARDARSVCRAATTAVEPGHTFTVGRSYGQGRIALYANCFVSAQEGELDLEVVTYAVAHEIGHEMGLNHVPRDCADPCARYATDAHGLPICGPSVMNPSFARPDSVTAADIAEYDRHARNRTLKRFR